MLEKMQEVDAKVAAGEDSHRPLMILGLRDMAEWKASIRWSHKQNEVIM